MTQSLNIKEDLLIEKTRKELINKTKNSDKYKDPKFAKLNRYTRRNLSKIATTNADYNKIDMNALFKANILEFSIRVQGETNIYYVQITIDNILDKIRENVEKNNNLLEFKCIYQAIVYLFNNDDVYVSCDCPDWRYRQNFYATKQRYSSDFPEIRPSDITNPHDTKGGGCKHVMLVLGNIDWIMKISSVILNYIYYCKDNMEYNYAKYIFPKIYGMNYDKAVQLTLRDVDDTTKDTFEDEPEIINLANALGKRRGQFKPGHTYKFKK